MKEVAKARGLTASTVVKHLEELSEIGKLTRADFAHLVPFDIVGEIHEALAAENSGRLSPVFHSLRGRYTFETIRLCAAYCIRVNEGFPKPIIPTEVSALCHYHIEHRGEDTY